MISPRNLPSPCRLFWLAFWLAGALIVCKGVLLGRPSEWSAEGLVRYVRDLAIMSHADVLVAVAIGTTGAVIIRLRKRRSERHWASDGGLIVTFVASLVYGIVSVQVFAYLRSHLTYPLIYLAGDMKNMRSSLGAFMTPPILLALVVGPIAYLGLVWLSHRLTDVQPTRWPRTVRMVGILLLLFYVAWGHHAYMSAPWCDRVDRRVAENPHWVLVKSFLTDLTSEGRRIQLADSFLPEYLVDFETVAERRPIGWATRGKNERETRHDVHMANDSVPPSRAVGNATRTTEQVPSHRTVSGAAVADGVRPKNVIVYVLESVGAQYLGLYGSPYDTTPCLERELANSLVFDNFYAHCGVTANSLVAINLGIYPGLTWREYTVEQPNLPGTTCAQLVKRRGYRTAYITSGEIEYVNMDGFLRGRGYDDVWGYSHLPCGELIISWGVEDRCLVDGAFQWIDQDRDNPFLLMVWTQQTHHPYEPSPSAPFIDFFRGLGTDKLPPDDYDLGRYLNVLREADRQLGRLFDGLRYRGLADDTIVIVTGDHGEGFGSPHDIYGHGGRVFQEIVRVPLVLWNPRLFGDAVGSADVLPAAVANDTNVEQNHAAGRGAGQRRIKTIGGHIDLNPTLAELLGLPSAGSWQGRSLFERGRPPRAYFYAANDDYLLGVREHDWKYIYNANIGREQLFDLNDDPNEQSNVAGEYPDRCHELRQRLAAWMKYEERHIAKLHKAGRTRQVGATEVVPAVER